MPSITTRVAFGYEDKLIMTTKLAEGEIIEKAKKVIPVFDMVFNSCSREDKIKILYSLARQIYWSIDNSEYLIDLSQKFNGKAALINSYFDSKRGMPDYLNYRGIYYVHFALDPLEKIDIAA